MKAAALPVILGVMGIPPVVLPVFMGDVVGVTVGATVGVGATVAVFPLF